MDIFWFAAGIMACLVTFGINNLLGHNKRKRWEKAEEYRKLLSDVSYVKRDLRDTNGRLYSVEQKLVDIEGQLSKKSKDKK